MVSSDRERKVLFGVLLEECCIIILEKNNDHHSLATHQSRPNKAASMHISSADY